MNLGVKFGIGIVVIGGTALVVIKIRNKNEIDTILQKVTSGQGATGSYLDMRVSDAFNPNYARNINDQVKAGKLKANFLTDQSSSDWADVFANSFSKNLLMFSTADKELMKRAVTQPRNQAQISQIVEKYLTRHGGILFNDLDKKLNTDEMNEVWNIVKSKPKH